MTIRWASSVTIGIACAIVISCMCTGCISPLPRYDWVSRDHAMATMNERSNQILTVSASGRLSLHRTDGADAQLDCAMVYRRPDQFRLRAWKFSRAVLDFTIKGDDVWIVAPEHASLNPPQSTLENKGGSHNSNHGKPGESDRGKSKLPDSLSADHVAMSWSLIVSGFSPEQWAPCTSSLPETFAVCGKSGAKTNGIICEIDRNTLTTRSCYASLNPPQSPLKNKRGSHNEEEELFTLMMERYRLYGEIVFPTRIRVSSGGNTFTWLLDDINFNEPLAPRAFTPPRRAVKQP